MNFDFDRFHLDRFIFAGQFVGGNAIDLFGGVDGWQLENASVESSELAVDIRKGGIGAGNRPDRLSLGIVCVRGKAKSISPS
jgi:hypothetical protein